MVVRQAQDTAQDTGCQHYGYLLRDGALVCAECGAPSPSRKWRTNIYGVDSDEAKAAGRPTGARPKEGA